MAAQPKVRCYRVKYGGALGQQIMSACGGVAGAEWQQVLSDYKAANISLSGQEEKYAARKDIFTKLLREKMPAKLVDGAVSKEDYNSLRYFFEKKIRQKAPSGVADEPNDFDGDQQLTAGQERTAHTPPGGYHRQKRDRDRKRFRPGSSGSGRRNSGRQSTGSTDAAEDLQTLNAKLTAELAEARYSIRMLEKASLGDVNDLGKLMAENDDLKAEQELVIGQQGAFTKLQKDLDDALEEIARLTAIAAEDKTKIAALNKLHEDGLQENARITAIAAEDTKKIAALHKLNEENSQLMDNLDEQVQALQTTAREMATAKTTVLQVLVKISMAVLHPDRTCADRQEFVVAQLKTLNEDDTAQSIFRAAARWDTGFGAVARRVLQ